MLEGGDTRWRITQYYIKILSQLETGGVRLLGHQITSPPEQRRVVLLVSHITGCNHNIIHIKVLACKNIAKQYRFLNNTEIRT